jgi:hypothetical protein
MDGKNIADFIDPEFPDRMDELENEEDEQLNAWLAVCTPFHHHHQHYK